MKPRKFERRRGERRANEAEIWDQEAPVRQIRYVDGDNLVVIPVDDKD